MIEFSGQYGEPKAAALLSPLQRELNEMFESSDVTPFLIGIDKLSVVFRASGKVRDFGTEGPERAAVIPGRPELTIDLVIPSSRWRETNKAVLKAYLAAGIREAINNLIAFSERKGALRNGPGLMEAVEEKLDSFEISN